MPIEDHPLFDEWKAALELLLEAHARLEGEIRKPNGGNVEAAKSDLRREQKKYNEISDKM